MLKINYLKENFVFAKKCLENYDFDENSIDDMLKFFRISSNAVYPFKRKDNQEICFLRLSPIAEKSLESVKADVEIIDWLSKKRFNIMKPYPMKDGLLVKEIDNYNVTAFERVHGNALDDIDLTFEIIRKYGESLGRLHQLLKDCPYKEMKIDHKVFIDKLYNELCINKCDEIMLSELDELKKEIETLKITNDNYGIIHYDYEADNVFYDEFDNQIYVIDFDDSIKCFNALDIVRALDSLKAIYNDDIEEANKLFIEGYRRYSLLSEEDIKSFSIMRRLATIEKYATILHCLSGDVDESLDWMVDLRSHLLSCKKNIENDLRKRKMD